MTSRTVATVGNSLRVRSGDEGVVFDESLSEIPAARLAAQRVADVRDDPQARLALLRSSYGPADGAPPLHLRYARAALAFMSWQVRRGLLNPLDHERRAARGGER